MKWPDWFGRRAAAEYKDLDEAHHEALSSLGKAIGELHQVKEANLRLIDQLRELDQHVYNLYQCAPDWKRMQPIVARMYEATEKRMAQENDRIKNLMVGEITQAYNEPPQLTKYNQGRRYLTTHEGVPIYEDDKLIEGKKE